MKRKVCYKCKNEFEINQFDIRKDSVDGHRNECKECRRKIKREYRNQNREKINEYLKNLRLKDVEKARAYMRNYHRKNHKKEMEYKKERYHSDPIYKLTVCLRSRINLFFKSRNIKKYNATFKLIGCSPEELKIHIEKQFTEDMSWENYGYYGWHIDHKIPLGSGKNEEEISKLCYYTNLQPLWWKLNFEKSNN